MDFYESLKKSDVRNTERKIDDDVLELLNNKEYQFLAPYLKGNGKPLYTLITNYIKKIGKSKAKNDPNLTMLAPIIAAMESMVKNK